MRRRFMNIGGDVIYYTSTDGNIIVPYSNNFGDKIISNTYNNGVGKIKFKDKITTIDMDLFFRSTRLKTITIPSNVIIISSRSFEKCSNLINVTIGNSVTKIGYHVFYNCYKLTSITIPNSVTTIEESAFGMCTSLKTVYCKPTTPPTLDGTSVFDYNGSGRKIYVPYQSLDAYKTALNWSKYADDIVGYDFENDTVVGGGSKQVNTITLRPYIAINGGASSLSIDYNALFPISSEMIISITTNGVEENCSIWLFPGYQIGTKTEIDLEPSSSEITVTSIDPQEDDNYIYEVVVEYE